LKELHQILEASITRIIKNACAQGLVTDRNRIPVIKKNPRRKETVANRNGIPVVKGNPARKYRQTKVTNKKESSKPWRNGAAE